MARNVGDQFEVSVVVHDGQTADRLWVLSFATVGETSICRQQGGTGERRFAELEQRIKLCVVLGGNDVVASRWADLARSSRIRWTSTISGSRRAPCRRTMFCPSHLTTPHSSGSATSLAFRSSIAMQLRTDCRRARTRPMRYLRSRRAAGRRQPVPLSALTTKDRAGSAASRRHPWTLASNANPDAQVATPGMSISPVTAAVIKAWRCSLRRVIWRVSLSFRWLSTATCSDRSACLGW